MRVRKLLLYFIPLLVVSIVFFGYKNSEVKNTATSLTEAYGTDYKVPTYEPGFIDAIGSWSTGALALSRYYSGGVGYSRNDTGWIYTWGGDSVGAGKPSRTVYRYNVNTNVWSQVAPYPDSIRICASARLGDSLYGMGGINIFGGTAPPVAAMYMYNVNTNTWSTKAPLPQALYFNRAAGYQDSLIYHVGGYTGAVSVNNVYLYNAKTNTWRNATPLPIGTAEGACTIVGDTIVYVGGLQGGVVVGTTYRGVISQSDRSVITWTTGASYPTGVKYRMNAYNWGSKGALVVGGAVSGFTGTNTTYLYSPGANTWTLQQNKPTVICAYQGGVVNYSSGIAKCVIAGGVGSGALTGANEIFTDTLSTPPPPSIQTTITRGSLNKAIPDNTPAGIADSFMVTGGGTVLGVEVVIDSIVHTWCGDLKVTLTHAGKTDTLVSRMGTGTFGLSQNDLINVALKDTATRGIWTATAADSTPQGGFRGSWRPGYRSAQDSLAKFIGTSAAGSWVVRVSDNASGDLGTWHRYTVRVTTTTPLTNTETNVSVLNDYSLSQNYPNPFNPTTKINFSIPKSGLTTLKVYDILGKEVATLVNGFQNAGNFVVEFDASRLASGAYFYRLEVNGFVNTKKMLLIK
ncbi:MAG TPA: kelch repeat-containing protein [Ignavibacteria bacterium]|nr:kelch repeat-containing protein [Ignavibacteria bacterium]